MGTRSMLLFAAAVSVFALDASGATTVRSYSGSSVAWRVDGGAAERLVSAQVVDTTTTLGTTSEATLGIVPRSGSIFSTWIDPVLAGASNPTRTVDVFSLDTSLRIVATETFAGTSVASIQFPALDAASTQALRWDLKLAPVRTTRAVGGTASFAATGSATPMAANYFRLTIDGTDTSRVSKVAAIVVTAKARPTVSNLVFWTDPTRTAAFTDWLTSGAVARKGTIVYLNPDSSVRCTTTLTGIVPQSITTDPVTARAKIDATVAGVALACN